MTFWYDRVLSLKERFSELYVAIPGRNFGVWLVGLRGDFRTTRYGEYQFGGSMMKSSICVVGLGLVFLLCSTPCIFAADGFGANAIGGEGGAVAAVDNAEDFKELVETVDVPYVVQISGAIDLASVGGSVSILSNKTIKGTDPNATVTGQFGFKKGSSNIIIERLNITNPDDYGEGDGISLKEDVNDVFITKCTFYDCDDDYNQDGLVNGFEFALFAGNWLHTTADF